MSSVRRVKSSVILMLVELPWRALHHQPEIIPVSIGGSFLRTTSSGVALNPNFGNKIHLPLEAQLLRYIAHIIEHVPDT